MTSNAIAFMRSGRFMVRTATPEAGRSTATNELASCSAGIPRY
jgi:hypothetical protein